MTKPIILNVVVDNKFIDRASREFGLFDLAVHRYIYIGRQRDFELVRSTLVECVNISEWRAILREGNYAAIILHTLPRLSVLRSLPYDKCVVWIGWGFDYYSLLMAEAFPKGLYLIKTRELIETQSIDRGKFPLFFITQCWGEVINRIEQKATKYLLSRIDYFAPVISLEYEMIRNLNPTFSAQYLDWNYGTAEDDLCNTEDAVAIEGNDILIGNSATPENNHLDVFDFLKNNFDIGCRKIYVPLSYGNETYGRKVTELGRAYFGESFIPLTEFLSISEYLALLKNCGFVFMGHVRQQGYANISSMMLQGAKIYMNEASPLYNWLISQGAVLMKLDTGYSTSIQQTKLTPLTATDRYKNRTLILKNRGRAAQREKTRILISSLLCMTDE